MLLARSLSSFDGDILIYAALGVAALLLGWLLIAWSGRYAARRDEPDGGEPSPREPEPPATSRSPLVERLRSDVRRWEDKGP